MSMTLKSSYISEANAGRKFAIVCSRFNKPITEKLLEGALECFELHGVNPENISIVWVPGAFEIPLVAKRFAESGEVDAVICLGAVIQGETAHFEHVAQQVASGIMQTALSTGIPTLFGVLTTQTVELAEARVGLGFEYAHSAIEMVNLFEKTLCV